MMSSSQSVVLPSFDETFAHFVHKKMVPMMTRFAKRQLDGRFSSQEIHDMIDGDGLAYGLIHCISGQMKNILEPEIFKNMYQHRDKLCRTACAWFCKRITKI